MMYSILLIDSKGSAFQQHGPRWHRVPIIRTMASCWVKVFPETPGCHLLDNTSPDRRNLQQIAEEVPARAMPVSVFPRVKTGATPRKPPSASILHESQTPSAEIWTPFQPDLYRCV
jgi:hypothetical protein